MRAMRSTGTIRVSSVPLFLCSMVRRRKSRRPPRPASRRTRAATCAARRHEHPHRSSRPRHPPQHRRPLARPQRRNGRRQRHVRLQLQRHRTPVLPRVLCEDHAHRHSQRLGMAQLSQSQRLHPRQLPDDCDPEVRSPVHLSLGQHQPSHARRSLPARQPASLRPRTHRPGDEPPRRLAGPHHRPQRHHADPRPLGWHSHQFLHRRWRPCPRHHLGASHARRGRHPRHLAADRRRPPQNPHRLPLRIRLLRPRLSGLDSP